MRHLLLASACACLAGHGLATDYGQPRTLRTSAELELDLETTLSETKVDDEPMEGRGPGGGSSSLVRSCVVVDRFLEGKGSAPTRVERTFETLHEVNAGTFRDEERKDERDFPLQGVKLELSLDDEGNVRAEVAEGTKPEDDALLEGHELTLALDALLPADADAVEVGASWDLDDATLKRALASALDARFFAEPPREEEGRGEGDRGRRGRGGAGRLLGYLAWHGKASLADVQTEASGLTCARITLELEGSGEIPERTREGGRGFLFDPAGTAETLRAGTVEVRLEGELLFALEKKRPVALKLEGRLRTENSFEREREGRVFSSHSIQEGPLTFTVQIEEQP